MKVDLYEEASSFVVGKKELFLLVRLKREKGNPLDDIQETVFNSRKFQKELKRINKMRQAKGFKESDAGVVSGVGLVFVNFDSHLKVDPLIFWENLLLFI